MTTSAHVPPLGRVGVWTGGLDCLSIPDTHETVAALEAQGWSALWFHEAAGREAVAAASVYLAASSRMTIASGIASIYARDAMAASSAGRTLGSTGRFVLGLGVSHAPMVENFRGQHFGKPVTAMRTYLDAMDAGLALVGPDEQQPAQRMLAALGPKMLALAGERAMGALTYLVTPDHTAFAREVLGPDAVLAVEQAVVVDPRTWQDRADWHLAVYASLPNYQNNLLRFGFTTADFDGGGSQRLKEAIVVSGLDAIRSRVDEHFQAGADHVCLQVLGPDLFAAPVAEWAELAPAVVPD